MGACNADLTAVVEESEDTVEIMVTAKNEDRQSACVDAIQVMLDSNSAIGQLLMDPTAKHSTSNPARRSLDSARVQVTSCDQRRALVRAEMCAFVPARELCLGTLWVHG